MGKETKTRDQIDPKYKWKIEECIPHEDSGKSIINGGRQG
jgi:hypothetical protein